MHPQGIGDSGQGFVNAVLFVLLTKQVRDSFLKPFCRRSRSDEERDRVVGSSDTAPMVTGAHRTRLSSQIASHRLLTDSRSEAITPDPVM